MAVFLRQAEVLEKITDLAYTRSAPKECPGGEIGRPTTLRW